MTTMPTRVLGNTDLQVSLICLGTMTWGQQNTEAEAHSQMDYALDCGVNFFDTAEMYPVPGKAETQGRTETYMGRWFAARKNRDQVILATKVVGPTAMGWVRPNLSKDQIRLDRNNIMQAVEGSLKRLQTDYIDLYQLHWPDRDTNYFGQMGYVHNWDESPVPLAETLGVMAELIQQGKIRHVGLSNETPWGVMTALTLAQQAGLPRVVSVQNPYSLLNRLYEVGLAEVSIREQCGLLAYSPLAFGVLSGKYLDGADTPNDRLNQFSGYFGRYNSGEALAASKAYVALARQHGLDPAQMALAFVNSRDFVTSNIIGATTMAQLKANIGSAFMQLPTDVLAEIEAIHTRHPNPSP
jgi:aryl-alcohol dehydrogenase-like predicted oxidoreductase